MSRPRTRLWCSLEGVEHTAGTWHDDAESTRGHSEVQPEVLRKVLSEVLTPRQQRIVELHFFEGYSQGAVARTLGVTQQVVHKALYGAAREGRVVGGALPRLRAALLRLRSE